MTDFLKDVFNQQLYEDINELKQNIPQVQMDYLIGSLLTSVSLLVNNRVSIQPKNHPKTNLNLYVMNVGSSGIGKSISSKPFINALGTLQKTERDRHLAECKFVDACKAKERDTEDLTAEQKEGFAKGLIRSNSVYRSMEIADWQTTYNPCPEFYITDFSPEALGKINNSYNNTGFIYADEYDKLISSVTRTKTVNDPCQFFTSLFDGEQISIIRKNSESESIDISLSLLINTTTANFKESVNRNGFFHGGFGARILYVFNSSEYQRTDLIPTTGTTYEAFSLKIYSLLDMLYTFYYKNDAELNLVIPEDQFKSINDAEKGLEVMLDSCDIAENITITYKTRLRVMLLKLIAITELINHTYSTNKRIEDSDLMVTEAMIKRGSMLLKFFMSNFIELFSAKKSITPKQEALLAQLTKGKCYAKDYLLKLTDMSESTLRRFLDSRTDLFSSEIQEQKKVYTVL